MRATCKKCDHPRDGAHHTYCKKCCAMRMRKLRAERGFSNVGKPKRDSEVYKRARERDKEKFNAREELRKAVYRGDIPKPNKCGCGNSPVEAHHEDYSKPFEVTWVCKACHGHIHRKYK